ncbi:hypothetical protein QWI17_03500 [Gilvimarinus sp. SDUM040013]|uniref:Uncharacterized protein n=1 Tax=Gilvimarinus gilvus TaxID=3058038 RepID=A0ABU4S498_9GAMM|nr:hypothetical protein [Gilvimarinus sp. SDUM040013]MDO3384902.1 hypothetical protein [Gilvimarinus sp. SDUM040013]MDX6850673.1 hypothetical protein [Gilvimarinus sp. SDUM040013]
MLFRTFTTFIGCTLLAGSATAANLNFMGRSISSELSPKELESFVHTVSSALNDSPDLVTLHWQSPDADTKGRVKIKYSYRHNEILCRKAILDIRGRDGRRDFFHFNVCQNGDKWELQKTEASDFSHAQWQTLHEQFNRVIATNPDGKTNTQVIGDISAAITPLSTTANDRGKCRVMSIVISNTTSRSKGIYEFCNSADGWSRSAP